MRGQHHIDRWRTEATKRLQQRGPHYTRQRELLQRVRRTSTELGVRDPVFDINGKASSQRWVEGLGVRTARVLALADSAAAVPWGDLPERFVVKPDRGVSGNGVFLLRRSGNAFVDARTGAPTTAHEVTSRLEHLASAGTVSTELVVEEMVLDPANPDGPPVDWKVLTFYGRVGLVFGRRKQPGQRARTRWFDETWQDLGRAARGPGELVDPTIERPVHAEEMLRLASRLSACVPAPSLRVDLYEDAAGPVFGEITPQPGGPLVYRRDVEARLGAMWEEAQARLMVRATQEGLLTPSTSPLPLSVVHGPAERDATTSG